MEKRIYADFQNLDDFNRIRLTCAGTLRDFSALGIVLHDGLLLPLYTDDADENGNPDPLLIDGIARFDAVNECWVAEVDWADLKHRSEIQPANARSLSA